MVEVLFFIAALGAIGGAIGVIALDNPFYSVLSLVAHLLSLSVLFLLLEAQFVAATQVIVYAGAVMVLYVFVVSYIGGRELPIREANSPGLRIAAPLFAFFLFVELMIATLGSGLSAIDGDGAKISGDYGGPEQIGRLLLTKFLLPFEVASFLLLVAAVGAVMLARRRRGLDEPDQPERLDLPRPQGTGTMAETVGEGFLHHLPVASGGGEAPSSERGGR